jgi:NADP-dependent 3-hydroxy acid dehydrogenase YdfG
MSGPYPWLSAAVAGTLSGLLEAGALPLWRGSVTMTGMGERLEGTVALVTGASSGIGEATASALARQGATVAVAARRRDRLEALGKEIDGLVIEADIADRDQAIEVVRRTVAELGRLDTVVNNAGVMLLGPADEAPLDEWDQMVAINVQGLLYVSHAAIEPLLEAAQDGPRNVADLVNVSSIAGRRATGGSSVYNLTKHGVGAFSEALRQEFADRHLRVSLVEPGAVATELTDHLRDGVREKIRARFRDIERLRSEDIAEAIEYIVTRPQRVAVNEILIRPTEQHW